MDKTIYLNDLNVEREFTTLSWKDRTAFQNAKQYLKYFNNYFWQNKELAKNATKLCLWTLLPNTNYALINFKGYYAFIQVLDEWCPKEVSNEIYCFDEARIYPMQMIEKTIDFTVYTRNRI